MAAQRATLMNKNGRLLYANNAQRQIQLTTRYVAGLKSPALACVAVCPNMMATSLPAKCTSFHDPRASLTCGNQGCIRSSDNRYTSTVQPLMSCLALRWQVLIYTKDSHKSCMQVSLYSLSMVMCELRLPGYFHGSRRVTCILQTCGTTPCLVSLAAMTVMKPLLLRPSWDMAMVHLSPS